MPIRITHTVSIDERELEERFVRSSGPGGQNVIRAERFRTQDRNREDARERLVELIRQATHVPKHRIATKPTRASKERRLEGKGKRSTVKKLRSSRPDFD